MCHLVIFLIRLKTKEVVISKGSSTLLVSPSKGKCFSLQMQAAQRVGERKKKTSQSSCGKVSEVFSLLLLVFKLSSLPNSHLLLQSFCTFLLIPNLHPHLISPLCSFVCLYVSVHDNTGFSVSLKLRGI